jgi:hypothetical protein
MAKGKSRGGGGGLLSMGSLKKLAIGAAVSVFAYNKLKAAADDSTQKGSITSKVAGALGFKGPGVEA